MMRPVILQAQLLQCEKSFLRSKIFDQILINWIVFKITHFQVFESEIISLVALWLWNFNTIFKTGNSRNFKLNILNLHYAEMFLNYFMKIVQLPYVQGHTNELKNFEVNGRKFFFMYFNAFKSHYTHFKWT